MENIPNELVNAGAWIGRQQAFALIGSKCSAAQAQCLREIRESHAYEKLGVTWDEFCPRYAAISRSKADDLIRRLDEFGQDYFRICEVARISPEAYRQIADLVHDETVELDGKVVPLIPENAPRIRLGIRNLRAEINRLAAGKQRPSGDIVELSDRLDSLLRDVNRRIDGRVLPDSELAALRGLTDGAIGWRDRQVPPHLQDPRIRQAGVGQASWPVHSMGETASEAQRQAGRPVLHPEPVTM